MKTFSMSKYASEKDYLKAKLDYFENLYYDTQAQLDQLKVDAQYKDEEIENLIKEVMAAGEACCGECG